MTAAWCCGQIPAPRRSASAPASSRSATTNSIACSGTYHRRRGVGGARGARAVTFAVHFDELAFADDLTHATAARRRIGLSARREVEVSGVGLVQLLRCDPHGHDGTQLERCVKVYFPAVGGAWRMVRLSRSEGGRALRTGTLPRTPTSKPG